MEEGRPECFAHCFHILKVELIDARTPQDSVSAFERKGQMGAGENTHQVMASAEQV